MKNFSNSASGAAAIHLIENDGRIHRLEGSADEYESGYWAVSEGTAEELMGGDIYFHPTHEKPSYFGGQILGYRRQSEGEYAGRIIFRFRYDQGHRGVMTGKDGWPREKKIVRWTGDLRQSS